jgi:hypothetical protein
MPAFRTGTSQSLDLDLVRLVATLVTIITSAVALRRAGYFGEEKTEGE